VSPRIARPDTFTYHFGKGRGVRWHDRPRGLLWLCAFDDAHDRGYEHAERLQQSETLYPDIESAIRLAKTYGRLSSPDTDAILQPAGLGSASSAAFRSSTD
jgi:hypothetical protein